ncbi:MAG TPA: hypothetical protein VIH82_04295 [Acidimicrobiia bacterium]|jgi:hypothetical protein
MMHVEPTTPAPTWYASRRVPASVTEVRQALGDALRADPLLLSLGPDSAIDAVHSLWPDDARGFTARLRLGTVLGTTGVEIEVEPWSREESVLGLRPVRRAPVRRAARYFDRVFALLDALEACLLERIVTSEPLEVRRAS